MIRNPLVKILVVDDDADILALAKIALKEFEVRCVRSGEEGIREAARFMPDLILMDLYLPGMDGKAAADQLRSQKSTATIPIVFLSVEKVAGLQIKKPFNPLKLAEQVREIWKQCA